MCIKEFPNDPSLPLSRNPKVLKSVYYRDHSHGYCSTVDNRSLKESA